MFASIDKADKFIAPVLGVISLLVYLVTLSAGAYPGSPSLYAVESMGLFPRMTPDHPLWTAIAYLVGKGGVQALNCLSAVCASLGVALLYDVMRRAVYACFRKPEESEHAATAARLAGLGSALALAFSTPYWVIATRSHPAAFHVLLFVFTVHCFFRVVANGSFRVAMLFSFLYGVGIAEYATFIVFLPLFGLGLSVLLWRRQQLSRGRAAALLACLLAGLLLYLVAALAFYKSPGYELREYTSFPQILRFMWRDQYWMLSRSLPQQGWLLILIVTAVPWITALSMAKRAMTDEQDWTFHILHVVLTAVAVAVLLNLPIAPWPQFGFSRLLVMPYVLVATTFGYALAYYYMLTHASSHAAKGDAKKKTPAYLGKALILAGFALLLWLPARNFGESNGRPAGIIKRFAELLVSSLEGREWLVTNGVWDNHLMLAAHQQNHRLHIINLAQARQRVYQNYVASMFDDARLRNKAGISLDVLIEEWFRSRSDIHEICAVQDRADLWINTGFRYVPNGLVFFGSRDLAGLGIEALVENNKRTLKELQSLLDHADNISFLGATKNRMRPHSGLVANNLGFLLQDLDRPAEAFLAYSRAREIDPENISALLNLNSMLDNGFITTEAEAIRNDYQAFKEGLGAKYRISDVMSYYGFVRLPEAFLGIWRDAENINRSGISVPALKQAAILLPHDHRAQVKAMLAHVYFQESRDDESEVLYYEVLVENPDNQRALLGMARLEMRKGNLEKARSYLEHAEQVGVPASLMAMEWASFEVVKGELQKSRERLEKLLKAKPDLLRAWSMLAGTYISQQDAAGLRKCIERLRRTGKRNYVLSSAEGHLALLEGHAAEASAAFEETLSYRPNDIGTLEILLNLDMLLKREKEADRRVRQLLSIDPNNLTGNRMLGAIHIAKKQFDLAADSLKQVLEHSRDPVALNDLAWVLQESGLYEEAESHAREALSLSKELHAAWHTLGVILLKTDRRDEARQSFERALEINENNVSAAIHLMKLSIEDGNRDSAAQLLAKWLPERERLPKDMHKELDRIEKALNK